MPVRIIVTAGKAAQDDLHLTVGRAALLVIALVVVAGIFAAGTLAFTGHWRSWYTNRHEANHRPLAAQWFSLAALLTAVLLGLNELAGPAGIAGIMLVMATLVVMTLGRSPSSARAIGPCRTEPTATARSPAQEKVTWGRPSRYERPRHMPRC